MEDDILKDSRFTKYLNDPRYRQIPRHERKVKIDKRFQSMFKDDKFKVKYTVDKRGRPVNETSTENLRRYYDIESEDGSSDEDEDEGGKPEKKNKTPKEVGDSIAGQFVKKPKSESEHEESDREDVPGLKNDMLVRGKLEKKIKEKLHDLDIDYARGEGLLQSDSSSEEESSAEEGDSEEEDHCWGELDADAETTEDATRRLAVCNMDWDNMKASDILVLFNSFIPAGGVIHKVTIYPSEYGLKRMQEEEVRGPIELTEKKEKEDELPDDGGHEEGSTYNMEKLRRYQLNRLKYYYAVVECDSVATADKLYTECDGMEYESSATKLDLRFIPDDTIFDQEPKEVCTKLPDLAKYKPRLFTTTALQQAKVELTWDTTNPNRTEVIRNALDGQIDDLEIKEYLASSTDDDDDNEYKTNEAAASGSEEEDPILKYKSLLQDIHEKEERKKDKDMEMEITWGLGVKEKAEELVKKKQAADKDLTPFETMIEKRKEKKKQKKLERKEKIEKLKAGTSEDNEDQSEDDIPSDVDMNDPYFAEEFSKPEFKKKKQKKTKAEESEDEEELKRKAELELLLDDDDGKEHFSLKKIQESECETKKSKRKKKLKEKMRESKQALPDFDINVDDERFSALFQSHHYNIDPTDPNYKKTKNMEKLIQEKLKRRPAESSFDEQSPAKKTREEAELSLLVKSIKRKTKDAMMKRK